MTKSKIREPKIRKVSISPETYEILKTLAEPFEKPTQTVRRIIATYKLKKRIKEALSD